MGRTDPAALVVLAGTAEARAVLEALAPEAAAGRLRLVASLAGATRAPAPLPGEMREGGFGGPEAMADWLRAERIAALIDATHPFAARISANAAVACREAGTARLRLSRPSWDLPGPEFGSVEAALAAVPSGGRVLAATGSGSITALRRDDVAVWVRTAEPPRGRPEGVEVVVSRPPHRFEDETALLRRLRITHLIVKNSGGRDRAKIEAATALGAVVLPVARPPDPPGARVSDPAAATAWARATLRLAPAAEP